MLLYGGVMGAMNLFFYAALEHIPLGIAVALEFTGPLAVALLGARRPLDFAWIALALIGFASLLPGPALLRCLTRRRRVGALRRSLLGRLYHFRPARRHGGGPHIAALGVAMAAVIALPFGMPAPVPC